MAQETIAFGDGGRYEGEVREGERHGQGVYTGPDEARYEGEFRDNLPNGQGVMMRADGTRLEGEFRDGEIVEG